MSDGESVVVISRTDTARLLYQNIGEALDATGRALNEFRHGSDNPVCLKLMDIRQQLFHLHDSADFQLRIDTKYLQVSPSVNG